MTMTKAVRMRGARLMAEAMRSEWERRARALGGAFLAVVNHRSGKAGGEDQAPREARLSARERKVKVEMAKRNEFIPRDDSPAARVNAKANPFLPKDLEIDGRNPFVPK